MIENFDLTSGALTAIAAVVLRMLEAVWKEVRKRSKRSYKLKSAQEARDFEMLRTAVRDNATIHIAREDYVYITNVAAKRPDEVHKDRQY